MIVKNSEFLSVLDGLKPLGTFLWINRFIGDPNKIPHEEWKGLPYRTALSDAVDSWGNRNTYYSTAALKTISGRTKDNFSRLLVLVADDITPEQLNGTPSYILETSPGKFQAGVFIDAEDERAADAKLVASLIDTLARAGHMSVDRSGNNIVRYVRLPLGQNQKRRDEGPFNHVVHQWEPDNILSLEDAAMVFGIDMDAMPAPSSSGEPQGEFGKQADKLSAAVRSIITGDSLHDPINVLTASLVASGAHPGAVVNITRALMDGSDAPRDDRWKQRYEDIPRAVTQAEKFKPELTELPQTEPSPDRFKFLKAGDLRRQQRVGWRVLDVIPKKGLVVMWGQPGSGKSFAAFDIGAAIARGIKYQGKRVKQGLVLIIAAEGDLTARTMAYMKEHNLRDEDMESLMILQRGVNMLDKDQDMTDLMASIQAAKEQAGEELALVIIDTLNRVMPGGNENASEHMGAVISSAKLIEDAHSCAVMFVHHSGKDEGKGTRGHSSLKGAMDSEISILRNEDIRTFKIEKQKEGKDYYELFNFKLKTVDLGAMSDFDPEAEYGERLTSCVLEVTDEQPETKQQPSRNKEIFERALDEAESGNREVVRMKYYELHRGSSDAKRRGFNRDWNAYSRSHLAEGYVRKYPKDDE